MFRTLFSKITLALLALFVILGGLLVSQIDNSAQSFQAETSQKLHLDLAKNIVDDSPLWLEGTIDPATIEEAFHMMMVLGPSMELYIVSPEGQLMNYSDPEGAVVRDSIDMGPLQRFLQDNTLLPILGDDPRSLNAEKIFSVAPIYGDSSIGNVEDGASPEAYLYIIIGGEIYDSVVDMLRSSRIASIGTSVVLAGLVFFLCVMLLLFFFLTRPIRKLSSTMTDFRNSNFLELPQGMDSTKQKGRDELGKLSLIFSEMAARVVSQFDEMIKNKNLRQELVTHISHDLKTPLASVKGYLESWQINQKTQTDEEAQHCIEVAVKNCELLERMVEDLFELSRLDAEDITPENEAFPLDELLYDIVQKLKIKAEARSVEILCHTPDHLAFVYADIGQIDRVITNLLDNALRHSRPNTKIVVSLSENSKKNLVEIKITDSGNGIPKEDVSQLFEPYFKASNQDRHYAEGTGLGLAITKRLLSLHNSSISVDSVEGVGSEFRFSLASATGQ